MNAANIGFNSHDESGPQYQKRRFQAWTFHMNRFYDAYFAGAKYSLPSSRTAESVPFKTAISTLMKLNDTLNTLVNTFQRIAYEEALATHLLVTYALPRDGTIHQAPIGTDWPPLNCMERTRLQRAILRYELFCRLNGMSSAYARSRQFLDQDPDAWMGPANFVHHHRQAVGDRWKNPFYGQLPADEFEEIMCVRSLVHMSYFRMFAAITANFERDVNKIAPSWLQDATPKDCHHHVCYKNVCDGHEFAEKLTNRGNLPFGSGLQQHFFTWIDDMSSLGLAFLQTALSSDINAQTDLLRATFTQIPTTSRHPSGLLLWGSTSRIGTLFDGRHGLVSKDANERLRSAQTPGSEGYGPGRVVDRFYLQVMGWAIFDDERRCRFLKLPCVSADPGAPDSSRQKQWLRSWKEFEEFEGWQFYMNGCWGPDNHQKLIQRAKKKRVYVVDWQRKIVPRYSLLTKVGDYLRPGQKAELMTLARAIMDYRSDKIPGIRDFCAG